jgi:type VI protein secretion system component VasF
MTLIELCDEAFQYICFLKRNKNSKVKISFEKARNDIFDILNSMDSKLIVDSNLWRQYKRIKVSLLFFIDSIIYSSKISFAEEWNKDRLAYQQGVLTGDKKFFIELENMLSEYTTDADECLKFFYICLGLGFRGAYSDRPDILEKFMGRIKHRIYDFISNKGDSDITENYREIDCRYLLSTRWFTLQKLTMYFIFLLAAWLTFNTILYFGCVGRLSKDLDTLIIRLSKNSDS